MEEIIHALQIPTPAEAEAKRNELREAPSLFAERFERLMNDVAYKVSAPFARFPMKIDVFEYHPDICAMVAKRFNDKGWNAVFTYEDQKYFTISPQ